MRKKNEIRPSWGCLGAILGHFRSPLGVIFVDLSLVFKAFRENSLFSKNIVSRAVLGPTWHDLGRFWLPFWHPFGTQDGQKTMLKNIKKKKRKKSENGRGACQKSTRSFPAPTQPSTSYYYPKGNERNFKTTKVAFRHLATNLAKNLSS